MLLFYKIFTQLYFFFIKIASLFSKKAFQMISGRHNWEFDLRKKIDKNATYIWVHCASLGEFEQGRPLIEKLKSEKPQYKILLSFFSPSGYEIRKNYEYADVVCYLPFDSKNNAKKFIEIINPKFAVFVKYEFWFFMINQLSEFNIPIFIISAVFRRNQIFFKSYGQFYLTILKKFTLLFLQDVNSEKLLNGVGVRNTIVCGDTRVDRVEQIASQKYENKQFEDFVKDNDVIVCGSTWIEDEKIITEYINANNNSKFIIAPHEIDEKHIKHIESRINKKSVKYSEIDKKVEINSDIIIIDTIGLLSKLYRYGKIAYVGGGFGKGIHNILEASVYNIPVIFGPNHKKFKEALDLIKIGAAFSINNYKDFEKVVENMRTNNSDYENSKQASRSYFCNSSEATIQIFNKIEEFELI
jgi:3-deoxy-D-manno-octulosonic-acid transferase